MGSEGHARGVSAFNSLQNPPAVVFHSIIERNVPAFITASMSNNAGSRLGWWKPVFGDDHREYIASF